MLELKNVSKFYYNKGIVTSGFSKVSLQLERGEFVAITGESGSGKSTLLNVLSGLDSYEEGVMLVEGEDTSAYSEAEWEKYRRKYISNIFQSFNLVNSYTVYQNVELALLLSGEDKKDAATRKERIYEVLKKVDLYDYRNQRASRLSGGQKQRVAIARALVRDTPIIVADEPTGNLDSKSAANVMELLSRVASDKLVLVVTHNYEQLEQYATRRITLHDGRVTEDVSLRAPEADVQPQADESKGVYEDSLRHIGAGQRLRLGVRNAFNIVPKFLLLLLVFLFVSAAAVGYYASNLSANDNAVDNGYNYYFTNTDRNRIVLKKADGSPITPAECEKLRTVDNIESVYEDDLLLDATMSFSGDWWLSGNVYSMDNFEGTLTYGELPANEDEFIVVVHKSDYLSQEGIAESLVGADYTLTDYAYDSPLMSGLKVSGVMVSDDFSYDQDFYCSDKVMDAIRGNCNIRYSTVTIDTDGHEISGQLVPSDLVEPGEALVCYDTNYLFSSGSCSNKPLTIHVKNLYYSLDKELTISGTYSEYNWEKKTGFPKEEYEWRNGIVLINTEDYASLYESDSYQVSVFVSDTELLHETAQKLTDMGYTALCISDTLVDDSSGYQAVQNVLTIVRTVILAVATFFITYFVIRLIMKSRNTYFSTVRILGGTRRDCFKLLLTELITVLCTAYLLFAGCAALIKADVIHSLALQTYLEYAGVPHFAVIFAALLLMCLLIALRYSRKLFTASAMKTYKEVG